MINRFVKKKMNKNIERRDLKSSIISQNESLSNE